MRISVLILFIFLICVSVGCSKDVVSPLNCGINEARTGCDRYYALLKCHQKAVERGLPISYRGIKSIDLEIPSDFSEIPLPDNIDFAGCTIRVHNNYKSVALFCMKKKISSIDLPASSIDIDKSYYNDVPQLSKGIYLLVISDSIPWVHNRIGYDYGHSRKDVILVQNGVGSNLPIMPYDNEQSKMKCVYTDASIDLKTIEDLYFERTEDSKCATYLFDVAYQNNVLFKNIRVNTPSNRDLIGDRIIRVENCTNIAFEDIRVNGTYSAIDKYGYAFNLNNIWNYSAKRVVADGKWGVYGNNNMNKVTLVDCNLNRFDIHCYGRDLTCKNCYFHDKYNQFSSTYGSVSYEDCHFDKFVPYLVEGSYNASTGVDISFYNCQFDFYQTDKKKSTIARMHHLDRPMNKRHELKEKCLPNFEFSNCQIRLHEGLNKWFFFDFGSAKEIEPLGYASNIKMKNVTIEGDAEFRLSNVDFETKNPLNVEFEKVYRIKKGKKEDLHLDPAKVGKSVVMRYNGNEVRKLMLSK